MTGHTSPAADPAHGQPGAKRPTGLRRVRSSELLQDGRGLIILHNDEEYHLRITRLGKLILTK